MCKVSIIIPCYNQGSFIEEAINSVLAQSLSDFEIIIVNDGSSEETTLSILNEIKGNAITIFHTRNKGVAAARNFGISKSKGEFILPLDADDRIDKDFLLNTVPVLENNAGLKLVGTSAQYFGEINAIEILPEYSPKLHLLQNLFFNTSLFRKKDFSSIGGYDESFLEGWEDWDLYIRLVKDKAEVTIIDKPLYYYRIKRSSRNADLINEKKHRVEQQLFKKYLPKYLAHFPEPIQVLRDNAFYHEQVSQFERYKTQLNNSASYRLGHLILKPLKWIGKQKK